MSSSAFLPPVVAAWEHVGSRLATGGEVDPEAFLVAVEKLAPIAVLLGRVFNFLSRIFKGRGEKVRWIEMSAPPANNTESEAKKMR